MKGAHTDRVLSRKTACGGCGGCGVWMTYLWRYRTTGMHRIRVRDRLGSQTPSVPATPEPSSTHSCECSRAEKWALKSTEDERENWRQNRHKPSSTAKKNLVDELQLRRPPQMPHDTTRIATIFSTSCNCGSATVIITTCTCGTRTTIKTGTSTTLSKSNWGISMIC